MTNDDMMNDDNMMGNDTNMGEEKEPTDGDMMGSEGGDMDSTGDENM